MTEQDDALRLAGLYVYGNEVDQQVAALLRKQHAEIEALRLERDQIIGTLSKQEDAEKMVEQHRAVIRQLVDALVYEAGSTPEMYAPQIRAALAAGREVLK